MSTQSVIKEIRQRTPSGFDSPVKIGSEQKYISTLLNSHNNNLEEQSILGVDCQTITWEDNNIKYITKKFFNGNLSSVSSDGYYILFVTDYGSSGTGTDFYFDDDKLCLPNYEIGGASFEQIQGTEDYILRCNNSNIYSFDENDSVKITPSSGEVMREETLCFRVDILNVSDEKINSDIMISKKTVTKTVVQNKICVQESIENYLN